MEIPNDFLQYVMNEAFATGRIDIESALCNCAGDAPSLPLYTVRRTCQDGNCVLNEGSFVLLLTGPSSQTAQLLLLLMKKGFKGWNGWNFGHNIPSYYEYVLTAENKICSVAKMDIIQTTIEQWATAVGALVQHYANCDDKSFIRNHLELIAVSKDQFVDKSLEIFCKQFQNELTKYCSDFSESSCVAQKKLAEFIELLHFFCDERIRHSPAREKILKMIQIPKYAPREETGDAVKGGSAQATFSRTFLKILQKFLSFLEKTLQTNNTLNFDLQLFNNLEHCFRDVPEVKVQFHTLCTELLRRKDAIKDFDKIMISVSNSIEHTFSLMISVGSYSSLHINHFLTILRTLSKDKAAQYIRTFVVVSFLEPGLLLEIEANKSVFLAALKMVEKKKGLEIDWDELLRRDIITRTLYVWYSSASETLDNSNQNQSIFQIQKMNSAFAIRAFLRAQPDQMPLSKVLSEAKSYLERQLEQLDMHATASILRAVNYDSIYETTFFDLLERLMRNEITDFHDKLPRQKIISSGVVWPIVAQVFKSHRYLHTEKHTQTIFKLFQFSINSLLMLSSLNVFYSQIKEFLGTEQREKLETSLRARRKAENYFLWFFDYKHYYAVAPPTISVNFNRLALSYPYVFFGSFCILFLKAKNDQEQSRLLSCLRDVLYKIRSVRKLFMKNDFRKIVYKAISCYRLLTPTSSVCEFFEKDWSATYAADIIGKPILGHFDMCRLEILKELGHQTMLVRVPRMPKPAVAIKFEMDFDVAQNELDRLLRVQGHPHVVRLYGFIVENDDHVGILVEHCEGGSLEKHLRQPKVEVSERDVLSWSHQASSGLLFLHNNNIVHRAVTTKIMMFNWKKLLISVIGRSEIVNNDGDFVAPNETIAGREQDVFWFGISMLNMISRKVCTNTLSVSSIHQTFFEPSAALKTLITRMMISNLLERPTMQEVYDSLSSITSGENDVTEPCQLSIVPVEKETHPVRINLENFQLEDVVKIVRFQSITELILYDIHELYKVVDAICQLTNLTYLDLSQGNPDNGIYPQPATMFFTLLTSLPKLEYLDISATNLVSQPLEEQQQCCSTDLTTVAELFSLGMRKKLKFLGIVACDCAEFVSALKVEQIAGTATEDQMLTAFHVNMERGALLVLLVDRCGLYYMDGKNTQEKRNEMLKYLLQALHRHNINVLQMVGLIVIVTMCYGKTSQPLSEEETHPVLETIVSGLEKHGEQILFTAESGFFESLKNSDKFSPYISRLLKVQSKCLQDSNNNTMIHKVIINVLQINEFYPNLVISSGVIMDIVHLLEKQLERGEFDEIVLFTLSGLNTFIEGNAILTDSFDIIGIRNTIEIILIVYTALQLFTISEGFAEEWKICYIDEIKKFRGHCKAHMENRSRLEQIDTGLKEPFSSAESNEKILIKDTVIAEPTESQFQATNEEKEEEPEWWLNEERVQEIIASLPKPTTDELESATAEENRKTFDQIFKIMQNSPDQTLIREEASKILLDVLPFVMATFSEQEKKNYIWFFLQHLEIDARAQTSIWCAACLTCFKPEDFVFISRCNAQQGGIILLCLLSHISKNERQVLGIRGGIELSVSLFFVEVVENARARLHYLLWSFLIGATNEIPSNCYRLMEMAETVLFEQFLGSCKDKDIIHGALIVMCNVAEVEFLRKRLLQDHLIAMLLNLEGEHDFVRSQLFALLLLDEWDEVSVDKKFIEEMLIESITKLEVSMQLPISYSSPKIFQRLLEHGAPVASQVFALCTLQNWITNDSEKYCSMLVENGFFYLLAKRIDKTDAATDITFEQARTLYQTLRNYWKRKKQNNPPRPTSTLTTVFEENDSEVDTTDPHFVL